MHSVSIIICTRDRAESLRETLASVGRCAVPADVEAELIVADNGSSDGTAEVVRSAGLTNLPVRSVFEPATGQTRARNAGLRASRADMVLFTDDDVRVPAGWIEGMCRPIFDGTADAVAGGVHFPPHYDAVLSREPFCSRRGWFASSESLDPAKPARMLGANMAFNRAVIEALGEFDTQLGPGALGFYDETLFAWRLLDAEFRLVATPSTSVEHHFDLSRLTRATMLNIAARMGRSEAYISHHWQGDSTPVAAGAILRARALLMAERFLNPWNLLTGRTTPGELQRVQTLAYWEQLAREERSPRRYQRTNAAPPEVPAAAPALAHP